MHQSGRAYTPKYKYHDSVVDGNYTYYGYVPESERTEQENIEVFSKSPPPLRIEGDTQYENAFGEKKICLFDLWSHPLVVNANGFVYPGVHQMTGSCVGAGGGNAVSTLAFADTVIRKEAENPLICFWPLPYGRSRYYLYGRYNRGDGSTGITFAQALREDGFVWATYSGLPPFTKEDGLIWGANTEFEWSTGKVDPALANVAKNYLVKSTAICKNADDVREAICNYYPVTCASNWGGSMQCPVVNGVLLNSRRTVWSHQQSILGWWEHPQLGEIFYVMNQWGKNAHGICPTGAPPGGYWVRKPEVDWMCQGREVITLSQHQGYPAQHLDTWYI